MSVSNENDSLQKTQYKKSKKDINPVLAMVLILLLVSQIHFFLKIKHRTVAYLNYVAAPQA